MQVFETNRKYVVASERDGTYVIPVRGESFSARMGRDLDKMNLTGCSVYKTESGAKRALKAMEQ